MTDSDPKETPPGPFRNGRLSDADDGGETRPNRLSAGQQDAGGQTRANPAQTSPAQDAPAGDPHEQTRPSPVYDPHGRTQELPAQPGQTQATPASQARPTLTAAPPVQPRPSPAQPPSLSPQSRLLQFARAHWLWGLLAMGLFGALIAAGGYSGMLSGQSERRALAEAAAVADLTEQVTLGYEDLQAARYDVARQRFEFVLNQDPSFPGAADGLVQALQVLNATATPTPPPATPTLTPTRDLRPVEELLAQALAQMQNSDWTGVIDTLNALRKEDPDYQVTRVDGYLYIALRYQGIDKIFSQSNLEGGIYDLSLAEQFGPLDTEALGARNLARLYIIGSSFWEAMPEQAVYYFSQVAAAAPYLRDASGWTARERYRQSLVQYGDQLAAGGYWCEAQVQYDLALSMQADPAIGEKADEAALICSPPTEIPTETATATLTPTPSLTLPAATTPAATTPVPTTPAATTPAATTPAATTPIPTTPAATTPVPTTPAATTEVPPPASPTPTTTPPPATTVPPPATTVPPPPTTEVPPDVPSPTPTETTAPPAAATETPLEEPDTATPSATPTETPVGLLHASTIAASGREFDV